MTSLFESFNKAAGKTYVFKGIRNDDQKKIVITIGIKPRSDRWKGGEGIWGYDSFFTLGAEAGDYSFETVTYNFENFDLNDVMRSAQGYINQLTLPFQEEQSIEAGKLIYFGVINITFVSFELGDHYQFSYRYNLKVTNDFDNDLEKFKTTYPELYEQFKDNIVTADFVD
jgi:hypothetical protein